MRALLIVVLLYAQSGWLLLQPHRHRHRIEPRQWEDTQEEHEVDEMLRRRNPWENDDPWDYDAVPREGGWFDD